MRGALLGLSLWPWLALAAAEPAAQRESIALERQALQQRHAEALAACQRRFAVTGCMDLAAHRQRTALEVLRDRELALDDADRRQRAAQRLQGIEARRVQAAIAASSAAARAGQAAVPPVVRASGPPTSASAAATPGTAVRSAAPDAAAAERRASAAAARLAESEAIRQRIEAREAARAARGKPAAALPVPAAGAFASGAAAR